MSSVYVEKNLLTEEDIAYGEGVLAQQRQGIQLNLSKVRGFYPVNSVEELNTLDPVKHPKAVLCSGTSAIFYSYIANAWVELNPSSSGIRADLANSSDSAKGAALIGFKGRTTHDKLSERISVKDFGAVGDGVTDDTNAFRACYQYIVARRVTNQSTVYSFSAPVMYVPYGRYVITGSITQGTNPYNSAVGLKVLGEDSILLGGNGTFNFFEFYQTCSLEGLAFHGGGRVFYLQTANADGSVYDIHRCTFQNQTIEYWGSDGLSNSTQVRVTSCKMYQRFGTEDDSRRMASTNYDQTIVENCWIYYGGFGVAFHTYGFVTFRDNLFVPNYLDTQNTQRAWFKNYGTLILKDNRFGSEGGGCCVIENYAALTVDALYRVTATGNRVYAANDVPFKFYKLPAGILIDNNNGYDNTRAVASFDSSITASELIAALDRGAITINDTTTRQGQLSGNLDVMRSNGAGMDCIPNVPSSANVIVSAVTSLNSVTRLVDGSVGGANYTMAGGRVGLRWTSPVLFDISLNANARTPINAAVAVGGWYTVIYHVLVLSATPISGYIRTAKGKTPYMFVPGDNIIAIQLPRLSSQDHTCRLNANIVAGDDFVMGPVRIFKGRCRPDKVRLEMEGTAAPTVGTFFVGEKVEYTEPAAGGTMGLVCTTSGTPGTWKTYGAVQA